MSEDINYNGHRISMPDSVLREQQVKDSQSIELIAHKVSRLATDMTELAESQRRMLDSITTLVRIEERQIVANVRLDDLAKSRSENELRVRAIELSMPDNLDKRLSEIESKMPGLTESRLWLIASFAMALGALFTSAFKSFVR